MSKIVAEMHCNTCSCTFYCADALTAQRERKTHRGMHPGHDVIIRCGCGKEAAGVGVPNYPLQCVGCRNRLENCICQSAESNPFRSKAQRRFMWARHPDIARRWEREYPVTKELQERVRENPSAHERITELMRKVREQYGERVFYGDCGSLAIALCNLLGVNDCQIAIFTDATQDEFNEAASAEDLPEVNIWHVLVGYNSKWYDASGQTDMVKTFKTYGRRGGNILIYDSTDASFNTILINTNWLTPWEEYYSFMKNAT